ncbi:hypothetical protein FB45DRAFT_861244 [Roridomyces roridus]|uniref:Uncharacterized protein n=1 Tax=Roridomyces roridus TaxID=1738132 RepID=A0AAD7CA28_9AGAR|nr:hypothetical protein FB45DRAFT_861244 [Roridomyces roridus]
MQDLTSLQSSLLFGSLSLIPNNTLRYTLLALFALLFLGHVIHLQRPSVRLSCVERQVDKTETTFRHAKSYCSKDFLCLGEQGLRLLGVKRTLSRVKCSLLGSTAILTWKKYRILSKDIEACAKDIKKIQAVVELILEVERQRRFTEDITDTETMLSGFRVSDPRAITYPHPRHVGEQSYASYGHSHSCFSLAFYSAVYSGFLMFTFSLNFTVLNPNHFLAGGQIAVRTKSDAQVTPSMNIHEDSPRTATRRTRTDYETGGSIAMARRQKEPRYRWDNTGNQGKSEDGRINRIPTVQS